MKVVAAYAHIQGIRVHMYLDDWHIRALITLELSFHTLWLRELCLSLGLIVNLLKSNLDPGRDCLSWNSLSNCPLRLLPFGGEMAETNQTSLAVHKGPSPISSLVDEAHRDLDIHGLAGSPGTSTPEPVQIGFRD